MSKTVLIVDDSQFTRDILKDIVEDYMHVVGTAEHGGQAVEMYKKKEPDVVLMDVVMPEMGGIEATDGILSYDSDADIVMCTSVDQDEKMEYAAKAGAKGYITKPFEEQNVLNTIDRVIDL